LSPVRTRARILAAVAAAASLLGPAVVAAEERPGTSSLDPAMRSSLLSIESALAKLRGLPFKSEVATAELTHEGARDYIKGILRSEYPGHQLADEQETLRFFRLLPPDQDLEKLYLDLMQSQVAGLYDPPTKTLYVVKGPLAGTIALAHELAHALMDQHFDLDALEKGAKDNDDRALALSSLIEGEATMVMILWSVQGGTDPGVAGVGDADPAEMIRASQAGMSGVPPFLRESLVFPYVNGMSWAGTVMRNGGGLGALDGFFREPPDSTEQILHPEKSMAPRDRPSAIDAALVATGIPATARAVKRDTMGEFAIRFLLGGPDTPSAVEAAEGWDGDVYVLAGAPGGYFFNWVSAWDSEVDADQFAVAIRAWLSGRAGPEGALRAPDFAAERRGRVVVVTEGGGTTAESDAPGDRAASILSRLSMGIRFL